MISRVPERILSVIAAIITAFTLLASSIGLGLLKEGLADDEFRADFEAEILSDPSFTGEDAELILMFMDLFGTFMWAIVIALIISLLLNVFGVFLIWNSKNAKAAGGLFILSGLINFILSPSSILLYVAAILSFTKKPPAQMNIIEEEHDDLRPL